MSISIRSCNSFRQFFHARILEASGGLAVVNRSIMEILHVAVRLLGLYVISIRTDAPLTLQVEDCSRVAGRARWLASAQSFISAQAGKAEVMTRLGPSLGQAL